MKLQRLDPHTIEVPEVRVTAQFDEDLLEQFKNSIQGVGQIQPILVYQVEDHFILCDGLHRLQEAIDKGESKIEAVVIPGDMIDVLTKNIFLDHLRGKTPASQMVRAMKALYVDHNLDVEAIREKTGLSRDYIERLIKISQASSSVQDALDQGIIGVGIAYELSRLPFAAQQEEIIAKHQVWRFNTKETKEAVDAVLREMQIIAEEQPAEGPVITPREVKYYCEGCKAEVEPRYLRPAMVCPQCFGELWRLAKSRATEDIQKVEVREGD